MTDTTTQTRAGIRGENWLTRPEPGSPCAIIAEVAQAHDGSLGIAHAFIDAAAEAGADAIKFQTHIAAAESTAEEPWRTRFSAQDERRYDYWRRMEFTAEQWAGLRTHADERGLAFLSSPFSMEAFELLDRIGVAAWKVGSGEINNAAMLEAMASSSQPVILSSGMSSFDEIDLAVERVRRHDTRLAVLQCSSSYPCPPDLVGLNVIDELRKRYDTAVGLSDHSATIWPGVAAAMLGIEVLEVHLTLSRRMFGPDVSSSLTTKELGRLVEGVRAVETMRANPVDKRTVPENVAALRSVFMKSVVAGRDLAAGTVLEASDLAAKKAGPVAIPAEQAETLVGRRTRRALVGDERIAPDDLEEVR